MPMSAASKRAHVQLTGRMPDTCEAPGRIAHQIADRLHVSLSARAVIKAAQRSLSRRGKSAANKGPRKAFYKELLKAHAENRALYAQVIRGR